MEKFAGRLTNIVLLGFFTTLFSLPVISAGAAFTALNEATKAYLYEDDDKPLRIYLSSFKENFALSGKVWILHIPLMAVLIWDIVYYRTGNSTLDILASAAIFVLIVLVLMELQLVFVLISQHKTDTVLSSIKMAFHMAAECFGYSLLLLFFTAAVIAVSLFVFRGLLLVMPGIIAYLHWQFLPDMEKRYRFRKTH